MDSKLVVREKRASSGDLPSESLCLGSVTSLALLLVWLRMSSASMSCIGMSSVLLQLMSDWPMPKDLTPAFFITTASSLVSSISTSLSLELYWDEQWQWLKLKDNSLPWAFVVIAADVNIFIVRVFVILTMIFSYLGVTITCKVFAHRHYLSRGPPANKTFLSSRAEPHWAPARLLARGRLHSLSARDSPHTTGISSDNWYLNPASTGRVSFINNQFPENLWQDQQKPPEPGPSLSKLFPRTESQLPPECRQAGLVRESGVGQRPVIRWLLTETRTHWNWYWYNMNVLALLYHQSALTGDGRVVFSPALNNIK